MPAPTYPVRCFLCNEQTTPLDLKVDAVGTWIGEHEVRFYAHHECMRAVASPEFAFPTPEQLDEEGRELVEQMEESDRELSKLSEEELREFLGRESDSD